MRAFICVNNASEYFDVIACVGVRFFDVQQRVEHCLRSSQLFLAMNGLQRKLCDKLHIVVDHAIEKCHYSLPFTSFLLCEACHSTCCILHAYRRAEHTLGWCCSG